MTATEGTQGCLTYKDRLHIDRCERINFDASIVKLMLVMLTVFYTVDNDPHFVVSVDGLKEAVCFDVDGRPGYVYQLLHDKLTGILLPS